MKLIAHRGISAQAPENTFTAFEKVAQMGIRAIETDLDLSADGVLYLIHDDTLARTTNGDGEFAAQTSDYLDKLDAGSWYGSAFAGTPLMRALDLVPLINAGSWWVNFELKLSNTTAQDEYLARVGELLAQLNDDVQVLVSSFNVPLLAAFKAAFAEFDTALLWEGALPKDLSAVLARVDAVALHPELGYVDADLVAEMHARGVAVNVWTVNAPQMQAELADLQVDGVFTDFPVGN
ncbi:MAG TPA: glycerophosphodiester phosphodiesterase family protein [Lactobacillaceae bacterium]|jgi:glycerophosphoryl diester phosphodiesterase